MICFEKLKDWCLNLFHLKVVMLNYFKWRFKIYYPLISCTSRMIHSRKINVLCLVNKGWNCCFYSSITMIYRIKYGFWTALHVLPNFIVPSTKHLPFFEVKDGATGQLNIRSFFLYGGAIYTTSWNAYYMHIHVSWDNYAWHK